jgi:hypothetical protein
MTEHVFLVGVVVDTDLPESTGSTHGNSRQAAEVALHDALIPTLHSRDRRSAVESWWIAEDDRTDGSDLDSATFCKRGSQQDATDALRAADLAWGPTTSAPAAAPPTGVADSFQADVDLLRSLVRSWGGLDEGSAEQARAIANSEQFLLRLLAEARLVAGGAR